jgi:hypothetical protein
MSINGPRRQRNVASRIGVTIARSYRSVPTRGIPGTPAPRNFTRGYLLIELTDNV